MRVGTVNVPVVEKTWSTWSFDINQEDLNHYKCKSFNEFLAHVKSGKIDIFEFDAVNYQDHDSELVEIYCEDAEGFSNRGDLINDHDPGDEDPSAWTR